MSKIYVVNSDMKIVIGMSDPNVMFKCPGSLSRFQGKTKIGLKTNTDGGDDERA